MLASSSFFKFVKTYSVKYNIVPLHIHLFPFLLLPHCQHSVDNFLEKNPALFDLITKGTYIVITQYNYYLKLLLLLLLYGISTVVK